ncbi:MAG TPA: hypothetical protein [Caudoviricetes sp.]|nr:MAG TPA: hypothetical protein [Caudoviricetes sp.]
MFICFCKLFIRHERCWVINRRIALSWARRFS